MRKLVLLVLINICFSAQGFSQTNNGPFGFRAGMTLEQIRSIIGKGSVKPFKDETYTVDTAPKPHPTFASYAVVISPKSGLVKVIALGKPVNTNGFGRDLRRTFDQIRIALGDTYGRPEDQDFLMTGSIWKEPEDFMMGLLKKERFLTSSWSTDKLPNKLKSIFLQATALSRDVGGITLGYEFEGFEDYANSKKADENKVF